MAVILHAPHFQEQLNELLKYTDLILLDLKHINRKKHINLTGMANDHILEFAKSPFRYNKFQFGFVMFLYLRISDSDEDLHDLGDFIGTLKNVKKIEILPYHKLGVYKWEALGLEYPLKDIEPPSEDHVKNAYQISNKKFDFA